MKKTSVQFQTTDPVLQKMTDESERLLQENRRNIDGYRIVIDGNGYTGLWAETSPMLAETLAKRDLEAAVNNQQLFMRYQRMDGRIPGMLKLMMSTSVDNQYDTMHEEPISFAACYGWLQGFCFPMHALKMYYLADLDEDYLHRLAHTLEAYDSYLWKTRDSDKDGCLEMWCEWDTGEDNSTRTSGMPYGWGGDFPKPDAVKGPFASMDVMSYSYACRDTLASISDILQDKRAGYWRTQAKAVADKLHDYLWRDDKDACFDRDKDHTFLDTLLHNNLRCMYYGSFSQDMADRFVKTHLKNPEEFWTPFPLPSIAANDPLFRNVGGNSWSGQPQTLTYERAIYALERYGYYAEVISLGKKLQQAIGENCIFAQQFDPFTFEASTLHEKIGFSPTILTFQEYLARMYGVHVDCTELYFNAIDTPHTSTYTQIWGDERYTLHIENGTAYAYRDDTELFHFPTGFRIITDKQGNIREAIRIEEGEKELCLKGNNIKLKCNEKYTVF